MRVDIYPNFATKEEIDALNEWVELGVQNKWLDSAITETQQKTQKRLTSRMYGYKFDYPKIALTLSDRIRSFVGISLYPNINGHGKDGIVVSYMTDGGYLHKHKDPKSSEGFSTLRCNILTQKAKVGGDLYIENKPININVGDLHCYLASEHEHWATSVGGDTPRIMWMFGAHVAKEDWDEEVIKVNNA